MKPYYQDDFVTIFNCDFFSVINEPIPIPTYDLLLTDPPYGIGMDKGMGSGGKSFGKGKKTARAYIGGWDSRPPTQDQIDIILSMADLHVVWVGNYMAHLLPATQKWLVWNKQNTMPTYSDAELAWTSLDGTATKMFSFEVNGCIGKMKTRLHPTQKPEELISWCIQQSSTKTEITNIIDPYAGSGTTGLVAKSMGKYCTLYEISEEYCEIAANRIRQEHFNFN